MTKKRSHSTGKKAKKGSQTHRPTVGRKDKPVSAEIARAAERIGLTPAGMAATAPDALKELSDELDAAQDAALELLTWRTDGAPVGELRAAVGLLNWLWLARQSVASMAIEARSAGGGS